MQPTIGFGAVADLSGLGIAGTGRLHRNPSVAALYEHALRRGEGALAADGQFVAQTGHRTARSPEDKFFVREPSSDGAIDWNASNRPFEAGAFDALFERVAAYLSERECYALDAHVIAGAPEQMGLRIVTDLAWHALFARNLFIVPPLAAHEFTADFTIVDAADFQAEPERDGTRSETFVLIHFGRRLALIGGTRFAGELKKAAFTIVNYLAPLRGLLPMHCSASAGPSGRTALFFGVSGSGKTTLAADPERSLIGDDEHVWSHDGITNVEGGCYAGILDLSPEAAPAIWAASHRFGTVLENAVCDSASRALDLASSAITDNARSAYPLASIRGARPPGPARDPDAIVMLAMDAYGVLPPLARLTPEQATYYFLSGYTAEARPGPEPGTPAPFAIFSSCFGAPFLVHHPNVYAALLRERIARTGVACWLANTGWTGGPCGTGRRIPLALTRALLAAAVDGALDHAEFVPERAFGLAVPRAVPGVPDAALDPRAAWKDPAAYDRQAAHLQRLFSENFASL